MQPIVEEIAAEQPDNAGKSFTPVFQWAKTSAGGLVIIGADYRKVLVSRADLEARIQNRARVAIHPQRAEAKVEIASTQDQLSIPNQQSPVPGTSQGSIKNLKSRKETKPNGLRS